MIFSNLTKVVFLWAILNLSFSITYASSCSSFLDEKKLQMSEIKSPLELYNQLNLLFPQQAERLIDAGMIAQYLLHMLEKEIYLHELDDISSTIKAMQNTHKSFGVSVQIPEARLRSLVHSKFSKAIYNGADLLYSYFANRQASRKLGTKRGSLELQEIWQAEDPFTLLGFRVHKKSTEYVKFQNLLIHFLEILGSPEVKRLSLIYRRSFGEGYDKEILALKNLLNHIKQVVGASFPEIFESNSPNLYGEDYERAAFLVFINYAIVNPYVPVVN